MSLEDRLEDARATQEIPAVTPATEFDGSAGYIQTGPEDEDFDPSDYDSILRKFGYDPARVSIVGPAKISKWQQRARIRGTASYESGAAAALDGQGPTGCRPGY